MFFSLLLSSFFRFLFCSYKYPKAGAPNSVVDVLAYSVSNKSLTRFPALREAFDYKYVMNVQWFGYASQGSFHASLVSSHDYIVVTIDPVGTKGKGEAYRKSHTYKRLGLQERDDMIAATRWIAKQCWADKSRISYWGWSYGGFMTSFVAAAGTNLYANLIAVAPVTSWTLYDSIYTERYMLRPQDNPEGYANTSVIAAASTAETCTRDSREKAGSPLCMSRGVHLQLHATGDGRATGEWADDCGGGGSSGQASSGETHDQTTLKTCEDIQNSMIADPCTRIEGEIWTCMNTIL